MGYTLPVICFRVLGCPPYQILNDTCSVNDKSFGVIRDQLLVYHGPCLSFINQNGLPGPQKQMPKGWIEQPTSPFPISSQVQVMHFTTEQSATTLFVYQARSCTHAALAYLSLDYQHIYCLWC